MSQLHTPTLDQNPPVPNTEEEKTKAEAAEAVRQWDPEFVRKVQFKLDLLIVPLICAAYTACSLDKSNLGNAKQLVRGKISVKSTRMGQNTPFSQLAISVSLTSGKGDIGYARFMIPFPLLGKRPRLSTTLAMNCIVKGIASASMAGVTNNGGAIASRFIVGVGEAGSAPLVPFYLG